MIEILHNPVQLRVQVINQLLRWFSKSPELLSGAFQNVYPEDVTGGQNGLGHIPGIYFQLQIITQFPHNLTNAVNPGKYLFFLAGRKIILLGIEQGANFAALGPLRKFTQGFVEDREGYPYPAPVALI
ncbi:MAG: hypothetical protein WCD80_02155 [Desulfobaccales bacterium]